LNVHRRARGRPGISEIVGSLLAIAITLVAGAAAWSFVRSQAGVSENALQNSQVANNNFLSERFNAVDMYFGASTATFWVYNTGSVTLSIFSLRLYDSASKVNLLYNYTGSGASRTDYIYDLLSGSSGKCKTQALGSNNYETPSLTQTPVKTTNAQVFTLTIPGPSSGCPSFGNSFTSGTTYTIVVTGLYGNVVRYSQTA
jgi:flagellin-like protein